MRISGNWIAVALLFCSFRDPAAVHAAGSQQSSQTVTDGRVLVTITTLEGAVHVPGVEVELRAPDGGVVIARSLTDGAGQVTFPDVPPGRYIVSTARAGFVTRDSMAFTVTPARRLKCSSTRC